MTHTVTGYAHGTAVGRVETGPVGRVARWSAEPGSGRGKRRPRTDSIEGRMMGKLTARSRTGRRVDAVVVAVVCACASAVGFTLGGAPAPARAAEPALRWKFTE